MKGAQDPTLCRQSRDDSLSPLLELLRAGRQRLAKAARVAPEWLFRFDDANIEDSDDILFLENTSIPL